MKTYKSLLTENETVCIKGDRRVPVLDGEVIVDYNWLDGIYAVFNGGLFATEDETIIKYMDNPKNGLGTHWTKVEEPEAVKPNKKV